jgi:uncharacterized protein (TIGR00645 family)
MTLIRIIETILFGSRWLLVPMYLGLLGLLVLLGAYFIGELIHALPLITQLTEKQLLVLSLSLLDLLLTANLVVVVIISGYASFVRRIDYNAQDATPEWMGKINFSNLKLRLLSAITVIGAVHLLRSFLEVESESNHDLLWQVIIVMVFGLLSLMLAVTDKLTESDHR